MENRHRYNGYDIWVRGLAYAKIYMIQRPDRSLFTSSKGAIRSFISYKHCLKAIKNDAIKND